MEPFSNPEPSSTSTGAAAARAKAESPGRSPQAIVSAALAAARATGSKEFDTATRVPSDAVGNSLADMAQRDLDAALQLLAERAQYITGANGAAIALRSAKNDLTCRASTSGSGIDLGALLSTEVGLSGESVKARQALYCDDTSHDQRVNREICRQLGIASVMVMPVVQDDQVLGVFELFSGKVRAFSERDLSALRRLSGMVETAVKLAHVSDHLAERLQTAEPAVLGEGKESAASADPGVSLEAEAPPQPAPSAAAQGSGIDSPPVFAAEEQAWFDTLLESAKSAKKPGLWSKAPESGAAAAAKPAESVESHVPPVLRNHAACGACGFPVSPGRELCVECEDKQWRGQLKPAARVAPPPLERNEPASAPQVLAAAEVAESKPVTPQEAKLQSWPRETVSHPSARPAGALSQPPREFVLSAGLAPRKSSGSAWFSMNKYVVGALLIVAGVLLVILILR